MERPDESLSRSESRSWGSARRRRAPTELPLLLPSESLITCNMRSVTTLRMRRILREPGAWLTRRRRLRVRVGPPLSSLSDSEADDNTITFLMRRNGRAGGEDPSLPSSLIPAAGSLILVPRPLGPQNADTKRVGKGVNDLCESNFVAFEIKITEFIRSIRYIAVLELSNYIKLCLVRYNLFLIF